MKPTAKKKRPTAEERRALKNHELWTATALCLGFNELAKLGKSLGEKVYARLARDTHLKRFVELGGNADLFAKEESVCTLVMPTSMPHVEFRASDIEMMREAVAAYDQIRPTNSSPNALERDDMTDEEKRLTGEVARLNGMLFKIDEALHDASRREFRAWDHVQSAQRLVSDALCGKGPSDFDY